MSTTMNGNEAKANGSESRKCYLYSRVSTAPQADESRDGLKRQLHRAEQWAAQRGYAVDDEVDMTDAGVSAWSGKNVRDGALGRFLALVQDGTIPKPAVLLVDDLDRFSRDKPRKAQRALEDALEAGVELVSLADGQHYTLERLDKEPMCILLLVMKFIASNEYSERLSQRVGSAWAGKRARLANGETVKYTRRAPGWLEWVEGKGWRLIPDRAKVVKRVFRERAAGRRPGEIANGLNRDGISTWPQGVRRKGPQKGRARQAAGWTRQSVRLIISNPAARGTLLATGGGGSGSPRERAAKVKERVSIPDHYPAVVDAETWEQAQDAQYTAPRGSNPWKPPISAFAHGLGRCGVCGAALTTSDKTHGEKVPRIVLVCYKTRLGGKCPGHMKRGRWTYRLDEAHMMLRMHAAELVSRTPGRDDDGSLKRAADEAELALGLIEDGYREALANPKLAGTRALADMALAVEAARETAEAAQAQAAAAESRLIQSRVDAVLEQLEAEEWDVPALGAALRTLWSQVVLDWDREVWRVVWRHAPDVEGFTFPATHEAMGFERP